MTTQYPIRKVFDLTDPANNHIFNMSTDEARALVSEGDPAKVRQINGHFALLGRQDHRIRLARSLSVPMRYFIAKQVDGPALVVAHRIDTIRDFLDKEGMGDQFHPSYTRMVPAHYITELALVGCPDPNPRYQRFFTPKREALSPNLDEIGAAYIGALQKVITDYLQDLDPKEPIGVCFSGGIDSGAVLLVTYHTLLALGMPPTRLKAFTLSMDGDDLGQARQFLNAIDLGFLLEPIEAHLEDLSLDEAVRVMEDYKPLDVQAGAMTLALCRGIRARYPDWKHLLDGDGGDENLKDYPIEVNPELTIRSVLNNLMLYHEGWGVDSIKHSLTYSGGLSRACTRVFGPATRHGFSAFSPFTVPDVVEVAEGIPFIELTDWKHDALYALKGQIVSRGIKAVTGIDMPTFEKRRFQHGALDPDRLKQVLPDSDAPYRQAYHGLFA